jgi:hypothetical protein
MTERAEEGVCGRLHPEGGAGGRRACVPLRMGSWVLTARVRPPAGPIVNAEGRTR